MGNGSTVPQQGVFRRLDMFACGGLSQASRCPAEGGGDGGQRCPHTPYTPWQSEPHWVPPAPQGPWVGGWTDRWMDRSVDLRRSWLAHPRDLRGERRAPRGVSADGPEPGRNEARPCPSGQDRRASLVGGAMSMPGKRCAGLCPVQPCPSHVMGKFCVWDRRCMLPVPLLRPLRPPSTAVSIRSP